MQGFGKQVGYHIAHLPPRLSCTPAPPTLARQLCNATHQVAFVLATASRIFHHGLWSHIVALLMVWTLENNPGILLNRLPV